MNPRILKKLCKRAAPLLPQFGDKRDQFRCGDEGFWPTWDSPRMDRKRLDRWGGKPNRYGYFQPLKNTIGVGGMFGYYEPEWDDETAWSALKYTVLMHNADFMEDGITCHFSPRNPSQVFKEAVRLLKEKEVCHV